MGEPITAMRGFRAALQVDMAVEAQVRGTVAHVADQAAARGCRLGVLVNNAAQFVFGDVTEVSEEDWDRVLGTNVKGCATGL